MMKKVMNASEKKYFGHCIKMGSVIEDNTDIGCGYFLRVHKPGKKVASRYLLAKPLKTAL